MTALKNQKMRIAFRTFSYFLKSFRLKDVAERFVGRFYRLSSRPEFTHGLDGHIDAGHLHGFRSDFFLTARAFHFR